jgi:hypothetical protein
MESGGGRGIRTPDTVSRIAVFKTACFNRSHIPPHEDYIQFTSYFVFVCEAELSHDE